MRDLIFSLMIFALLPVSYRRPLIGVLAFTWLAYMRPQDLCWGFAREQRWSFLIAGATLAGQLSRPGSKWLEPDLRSTAMILLAVAYVANQTADPLVLSLALIGAGATLGFFVWNYPHGLIFLGGCVGFFAWRRWRKQPVTRA